MFNDVIKIEEFLRKHRSIETNTKVFAALARFSWVNGMAAAIAARVEFNRFDRLEEWTAYWGAVPADLSHTEAAAWVIKNGEEMCQTDAVHFFPLLEHTSYR